MTDNQKAAFFIGYKPNDSSGIVQFPQSVLLNGSQPVTANVAPEPDMADPRNWTLALGYALTPDEWAAHSPDIYEALTHRDWSAIVKLLANLYDADQKERL